MLVPRLRRRRAWYVSLRQVFGRFKSSAEIGSIVLSFSYRISVGGPFRSIPSAGILWRSDAAWREAPPAPALPENPQSVLGGWNHHGRCCVRLNRFGLRGQAVCQTGNASYFPDCQRCHSTPIKRLVGADLVANPPWGEPFCSLRPTHKMPLSFRAFRPAH